MVKECTRQNGSMSFEKGFKPCRLWIRCVRVLYAEELLCRDGVVGM